jgi:hypothetical protein
MKMVDLANGTTLELNEVSYNYEISQLMIIFKVFPTIGAIYTPNDEHFRILPIAFSKDDDPATSVIATIADYSPTELKDWLIAEYATWVLDDPDKLINTHPGLIQIFSYVDTIGVL